MTAATRLSVLRTFWANPVVTRDLRVRLRGSKAFWNLGFYLGLLGAISLAGYGTAVGWNTPSGQNGMSAVDVQGRLQSFYYFIFITLAALITLIAPALTAVSITTERQRLSLDLLVTTPLTASELLVGKMLSSTAFLALLLALSLPASALCVILGGATLGDVIRVYILLALDGLVMAAIGLGISCATRASLPALVWTYLTVAGYQGLTAMAYAASLASSRSFRMSATLDPLAAAAVLNPFVAVYIGGQSFDLFGRHIPLWIGAAFAATLLIRLLVTAATYRLGRYGGSAVGSLRRQLLLLTGIALFAFVFAVVPSLGYATGYRGPAGYVPPTPYAAVSGLMEAVMIGAFLLSGLLLPSLFVPTAPSEDDPPGVPVEGRYSLRRVFQPEHVAALPYFHLWLLTVVMAILGGLWASGVLAVRYCGPVLMTAFYISGLGFLFWSLSRRAASWVQGATAGRALAFVLFAVLAWLPFAVLGVAYSASDWQMKDNPLAYVWILYPLLRMENSDWMNGGALIALLWSGVLTYGLGVLAYPCWQSVVPGGKRAAETGHANATRS